MSFGNDFALDLSKFKDLTEKKMTQVAKKTFLDLSTAVIKDTPVLTGRLRMNWFPAINKFSDNTTTHTDKSIGRATERVKSKANQFKLGDLLTLTNNLPYAERIEFFGWSKKAPAGMVRLNVMRFQQIVDKVAKGIK